MAQRRYEKVNLITISNIWCWQTWYNFIWYICCGGNRSVQERPYGENHIVIVYVYLWGFCEDRINASYQDYVCRSILWHCMTLSEIDYSAHCDYELWIIGATIDLGCNIFLYMNWNTDTTCQKWPYMTWMPIPWASCQIRKIVGCACAGNAGNVLPDTHGLVIPTCITARAWRTCRDACRGR